MSWLTRSRTLYNTNCTLYTIASQHNFYDWSFRHSVPNDVPFKTRSPQLNALKSDDIIIAVTLPIYHTTRKGNDRFIINSDSMQMAIKAGKLDDIDELIEKNMMRRIKLHHQLQSFATTLENKKYIVVGSDFPHVYRVSDINGDHVVVDDLGYIVDIHNAINAHLGDLKKSAINKSGRSHEMEKLRRFENAVIATKGLKDANPNYMDVLIGSINLSEIHKKSMSLRELFFSVYPDQVHIYNDIDSFFSSDYVQSFRKQSSN